MKPTGTLVVIVMLTTGGFMPLAAQVADREQGFPATVRDSKTPYIRLDAPEDPSSGSFSVGVWTADPSGIATVSISVEGKVVATRTRPPFWFFFEDTALPTEICALAVDRAVNSATDCALVGTQGTCLQNSD